jgi:hypothetical protein
MRVNARSAFVSLAMTSWLLFPTLAEAQGYGRGWFEQWSGPGSYIGYDLSWTVVCENEDRFVRFGEGRTDQATTPGALGPEDVRWCLDVGFGHYKNIEQDRARHGEITFRKYQALAMASPTASGFFELGAGAGIADFEGKNPNFGFTRFYVPARVVFRPLRLGRGNRNDPWRGLFNLVGNLHVFARPLTDKDTHFTEHEFQHHFQSNLMVVVDASPFFFRR